LIGRIATERADLFVNNRLEGNSPITIQEVISDYS
jgi:hypothetical protein